MSGKHLLGGTILGLALGAGALYGADTYLLAGAEPCRGLCGEGTVCDDDRCVLAPEPEDTEEMDEDEEEGGKKKRRRGRKKRRGSGGGDVEGEPASGPPLDNDSHVPRFDANADQNVSMSDGSGRLSDSVINRELAKLDKQFQRCVMDGAARVADIGTGTVRYSFGIDGKGKVTGVNASAPGNLKDAGLIPCVRKTVYGHKFPSFDGPTMKVNSSFSVD